MHSVRRSSLRSCSASPHNSDSPTPHARRQPASIKASETSQRNPDDGIWAILNRFSVPLLATTTFRRLLFVLKTEISPGRGRALPTIGIHSSHSPTARLVANEGKRVTSGPELRHEGPDIALTPQHFERVARRCGNLRPSESGHSLVLVQDGPFGRKEGNRRVELHRWHA